MAETDKKILFITPGATSAGGNVFLLRFLHWFKENSEIPFLTLYGYGGDLESEFADLSETIRYYQFEQSGFFNKVKKKISEKTKINRWRIKNRIKRENIGLIYSNAVINHSMLLMFYDMEIPIISHCHELESVIFLTGIEGFRETKKHTKHFIVVSDAVRQNLIENHQVLPENISLVYGFIPIEESSSDEIEQKREVVRRELNIPENAFIVGASGTLEWRKSPDIFIKIAEAVSEKMPDAPIYFVWVGGAKKGDFSLFAADFDVKKLGLENKIFFLEHKSSPLDYFAALDVFAMISREDPFPLVCLETASFGKPIICFENAGGMPEFVEDDCGFVVPYLDIQAMADKIVEFYKNPELKNEMGKRAATKVRNNHDILTAAPKILGIIERFLRK